MHINVTQQKVLCCTQLVFEPPPCQCPSILQRDHYTMLALGTTSKFLDVMQPGNLLSPALVLKNVKHNKFIRLKGVTQDLYVKGGTKARLLCLVS